MLLSTSGQAASDPDVVVAPGGTATIAWVNSSGTNDIIQSNTLTPAGAAGTVTGRSAPGAAGQDAEAPSLTSNSAGDIAMAWRRYNGTNWVMQSLVQPAGGAATAVQDQLPLGLDSGLPDVAARPDGSFVIGWAIGSLAAANVAYVIIGTNGVPITFTSRAGVASTVQFLSTDATGPVNMKFNPDSVYVTVNSAGLIGIAWRLLADRAVHTVVPSTDPPPDYHWSVMHTIVTATATGANTDFAATTIAAISPKTEEVSQLAFAAPPVGAGVESYRNLGAVAWTNNVIGSRWIRTAIFGSADFVSVSPQLSGDIGLASGEPQLAVNSSGVRIVTWEQDSAIPGVPSVQAMRLTSTGLFVGPTALQAGSSIASDHASPFIADNGISTVAFDEKNSGSNDVTSVSRFTDPKIGLEPDVVAFGSGLLNIETSARSIFVSNPGSTPNVITDISLTGPGANQFVTQSSACVKEIAAGANCLFNIEFRPTSSGPKSATIKVSSPAGDVSVDVTGKGVARTRMQLKVKPAKQSLKKGVSVRVPVTVTNTGGLTTSPARICATGNKRVVRPKKKCVTAGAIAVGAKRTIPFRVRLNGNAKKGKKYQVKFLLTANNANSQVKYVKFALKGKGKKK